MYAEHEVSVDVESGVIHGSFPSQALRYVIEWAELHRAELLANWERARQREPLERIPPLERCGWRWKTGAFSGKARCRKLMIPPRLGARQRGPLQSRPRNTKAHTLFWRRHGVRGGKVGQGSCVILPPH